MDSISITIEVKYEEMEKEMKRPPKKGKNRVESYRYMRKFGTGTGGSNEVWGLVGWQESTGRYS